MIKQLRERQGENAGDSASLLRMFTTASGCGETRESDPRMLESTCSETFWKEKPMRLLGSTWYKVMQLRGHHVFGMKWNLSCRSLCLSLGKILVNCAGAIVVVGYHLAEKVVRLAGVCGKSGMGRCER